MVTFVKNWRFQQTVVRVYYMLNFKIQDVTAWETGFTSFSVLLFFLYRLLSSCAQFLMLFYQSTHLLVYCILRL